MAHAMPVVSKEIPPIPSHIFFAGAVWGCGFHIGVYKALQEMYGLEALKKVKFAGNSSGAMMALGGAAGMNWQEIEKLFIAQILDGVNNGVVQKLSLYHDKCMDQVFDKDPNLYQKMSGKLVIGVTTWFNDYQLVSKWNSNDEIRNVLHASMHIPYYATKINKISLNNEDGVNNGHKEKPTIRAVDGGISKQFVRFNGTTLVVTAIVEDIFNPEKGDICSDPVLTFMDVMLPDLDKYYKMRENGYKMMMKWDGTYKNKNITKSIGNPLIMMRRGSTMFLRKGNILYCWFLRMLEEIKLKRIVLFIFFIMIARECKDRKYRESIWREAICPILRGHYIIS